MTIRTFSFLLTGLVMFCFQAGAKENLIDKEGLTISFKEDKYLFTKQQKVLVKGIITQAEKKVRSLLPTLPKSISVEVSVTSEKVDQIGGVNGYTASNKPAKVVVQVSNVFSGGITAAIKNALSALVFHEFHHLSRGWAINDNMFGRGISIAAVNEGLAVVFSETYTGIKLKGNSYPKEAGKWMDEVMTLPRNANYTKWMYKHPDGRSAVGYRAGHHMIRRIMNETGKNILELSKFTSKEILYLAGY